VQPFRVSGERLKRLFGNEITNDQVDKSILDYLYDHRIANETEDERAVWEAFEINNGGHLGYIKANDLGEKALVEITQAVVEYVKNTLHSIVMIKEIKNRGC
jgi:hypothetical protein